MTTFPRKHKKSAFMQNKNNIYVKILIPETGTVHDCGVKLQYTYYMSLDGHVLCTTVVRPSCVLQLRAIFSVECHFHWLAF